MGFTRPVPRRATRVVRSHLCLGQRQCCICEEIFWKKHLRNSRCLQNPELERSREGAGRRAGHSGPRPAALRPHTRSMSRSARTHPQISTYCMSGGRQHCTGKGTRQTAGYTHGTYSSSQKQLTFNMREHGEGKWPRGWLMGL